MIRIQKNSVVVFFLLLCSMRWEINDYIGNSITQIAENGLRIFAALCCVFLYIKRRKCNMKISFLFLLLILMQGWLILSTAIQQGDLRASILGLFPILVVGLLFESMDDDLESLIHGVMLRSEVLIYCNLLAVLLCPDGMYSSRKDLSYIWFSTKNWLLGNRNLFLPYCLFACLIAYIYRRHGGMKWREWGIYVACLISVILVKSATSTVVMILLLALIMLLKSNTVKFHVYFLLGINISLFFLIVVLRVQNLFAFLIEDVLGKTLTFTGRTTLWDAILPLIAKNPIFGLGVQKNGVLVQLTGISYAGHAHNLILDCLYRGGIIYLGLYVTAMVLVYRKLHAFQYMKESQAVSIVLFIFQIAALMEPYIQVSMFINMIYFIACYIELFVSQERNPINKRIRLKFRRTAHVLHPIPIRQQSHTTAS